jgi:hypothetical protein
MRWGVFGRARWARAGREVSRTEGVFGTRRPSGSVGNRRQKSADGASFGSVSGSETPLICRPTLHPCYRRDGPEALAHPGSRKPWRTNRPLQNDTLVTSALQACHARVTPSSCEKNLSRATPCEPREWLVTSCIERKISPFRPPDTPVGFAAVCSILRIMKPRNCPTDLLLRTAYRGVRSRLMAPRQCAPVARHIRGAVA